MMARKKQKGLSDRHKRILEVLDRSTAQNGYPPSIREICTRANISSTSVANYYLDRLEELGYIERDRQVARGVRLVKSLSDIPEMAVEKVRETAQAVQQKVEELLSIPVVGRIVANNPMPVPGSDFSYYDAETAVDIARSMLPVRDTNLGDLFALEVDGDSMIDAMVNDGDIVIMKRTQEARNGEMVAVWLTDKDETTLKYFYRENGKVRLQPANPTMKPIYIDDPNTVKIQGKVVMVMRQLESPVV
ncbi:MAG TPA: repressor LexA [Chloroflexi bacterium]|nr:repressor LexA [Chloroflexota bacterium]HBY08912.1 repressor LexA [Chloroflexota bacterium]